MPKKKKGRASVGGDAFQATPTNKAKRAYCKAVQIIPSSTPPVKRLKYSPMILLTADDADLLGVDTGDSVLLLSVVETNRLHATARALVYVASSSSAPSTTKSPSGLAKTQRSKLSPGYCHVFPPPLADRLQGHENTVLETVSSPDVVTSISTSIISSPPSKAKFSFRSGGGDTIIESHSTPQTTRAGMASQTRLKYELWVVPVECDLGDFLTDRLCHTAQEMMLQTDSKILRQSSTLGPLLILAHLSSTFVSLDSIVSVSVQGMSTPCHVKSIQEVQDDRLEDKLAHVSLDSTLDVTVNSEELLSIVQKSTSGGVHLYQITNDTDIIIKDVNAHLSDASAAPQGPPAALLAGLDDTVEKVIDLVMTPLRHPELFQRTNGLRPPKGVLLYGSSGSGKSTLAAQVAQFLRYHHNVHVHEIPCSKLQARTALVGQAEEELVRHFQSASRSRIGPASLLVMDDVHLICPRRQGINVGADRLAATLLALLDGVDGSQPSTLGESYHPVVILAVTNNPSLLDPALRRPGRLDAEVEIPLPDEPSIRSQIMKFQLNTLNATLNSSEDSEDWLRLARLAKGFTGADLQLAIKEAIRISVERSGPATEGIQVDVHDMDSAIRSIKPSAIKAVTVEIPQVHWASIGGMHDVKRKLKEAIELPATHGAMFRQLGIRPPRGVLLYGPPGCSKTLMARALATEGHMNFLAVKGPELLSKWLGESERALASLFRRARLASPSIVFFDEVDAIATKRGGGNSGGGERLLSQLLTELDGIQSGGDGETKKRVVVVCATNRPDLLDGALMRPGRIDRMIYVGVPDQESRKQILELGLSDKACDDNLDITHLAREEVSGGLSGAEIVSACRNAALAALEDDENLESLSFSKPSIGMHHMLRALTETERQITPEMIEFYRDFHGQKSAVA